MADYKENHSVDDNGDNPFTHMIDNLVGVVTRKPVYRRHCVVCGAFDVKGKFSRWIFCIDCGDSFHQSCTPTAPLTDHPISGKLPLGHYESWHWQCPTCRKCGHCQISSSTDTILTCMNCKESLCTKCDPSMNSSHGYYYYCKECHGTQRNCLSCKRRVNSSNRLVYFCLECSRLDYCPHCNIRYHDNDYSEMMISCDYCNNWTHIECANITKAQYKNLSRFTFDCCRCNVSWKFPYEEGSNLPGECTICLDGLVESFLIPIKSEKYFNDTLRYTRFRHPTCLPKTDSATENSEIDQSGYLRQGNFMIWLPKECNEREAFIIFDFWSHEVLRERRFYKMKALYDEDWKPIEFELENLKGRTIEELVTLFISNFTTVHRDVLYLRMNHGLVKKMKWIFEISANILKSRFRPRERRFSEEIDYPPRLETVEVFANALKGRFRPRRKRCSEGIDSPQRLETVEVSANALKSRVRLRKKQCEEIGYPQRLETVEVSAKALKGRSGLWKKQCEGIDYPQRLKVPQIPARLREFVRELKKPIPVIHILSKERQEVQFQISQLNKRMKNNQNFVVGRSLIAGLGLFARKGIGAGCKVIEYCGEVIGQAVADRREKSYSLLPLYRHDCYLFRVGDDCIIDATRKANVARFINHSCDPNCESKIERGRIIIYAIKDISPGEELSYNYKFSSEGADDVVPCHCGATSCRKFIN